MPTASYQTGQQVAPLAAPCAVCRTQRGALHPQTGQPRRLNASRYHLPGVLCARCASRLWQEEKRVRPFADEPADDGLTGETDRERRRIERRTQIVRERMVLRRVEAQIEWGHPEKTR